MRDELLHYYERELAFLRRMGARFADEYPKVASRLQLEPNKCEDPHVERLLQGFAFLAARTRLRIDDDAPELSEGLLDVMSPQYVRPIPSMSIVQFHLDPEQGKLTSGLDIPKRTPLYSRPVGGAPCRFRTSYDTTLWPVSVEEASWSAPQALSPPVRSGEAVAALRLVLRCAPELTFQDLEMTSLRFYLDATAEQAATIYELLLSRSARILVRDPDQGSQREPLVLPASCVQPVGFGEDEGMLPFPRRALLAYRLLLEYFAFPEKYFFLDLTGLERLGAAGFGERAEVIFLIRSFERQERVATLESGVTARTFRLGCTPVINLFTRTAEPVLLTQRKSEYLVVPDARRRETTGVYSVDDVRGVSAGSSTPFRFEPLYSFRHGRNGEDGSAFWYARRRPSGWRTDQGTDVYLSFVDLSGRTVHPDHDSVTAELTCHNGDLPSRLQFGVESGDFEMPGGGPLEKIVSRIKPTPVIEPPLGSAQLWRLISQLSLNYMSLVDGGAEGLRELLHLHNLGDSGAGQKQIEGLRELHSRPAYARIDSEHGLSFARGHRVEILLDESRFVGGGAYLFASVLERFLGLYSSLNSFCVLAARSEQRKEPLAEWPPRAGWKTLL